MSVLTDLRERVKAFLQTKNARDKLDMNVTEFISNLEFQQLVNSQNFLDQYIGWTYRAVQIKAQTCAQEPLKLFRQTTKNKVDEIEDNQLLRDLHSFNEEQTLYDARELIHTHLGLTGMAFVYIVDGVTTKDFYILDPTSFKINTDNFGLPVSYSFNDGDGQEQTIPKEQLLVYRTANPKNWLKGYSPVQASKYAHNGYEFGAVHLMNLFGNQGKMQGILTIAGMGTQERERIERTLREKYLTNKNAGKIATMGVKPEWTPISSTSTDMQMIEGLNLLRRDVLSMQGVPEALIVSDAKYSNMEQAQRIYNEYTIDPLLTKESEVLNEQLIKKYFKNNSTETNKLFFKFESTVKADKKSLADTASILFEKGIITRNEAREQVGQELTDDGDIYANDLFTNVVPATQDEEEPEEKKRAKQLKKIDREEIRQKFLDNTINEERKMKETIQSFLDEQEERVIEKARGNKAVASDFELDMEEEINKTIDKFSNRFTETAIEFYNQLSEIIETEEEISGQSQDELAERLSLFATEINETTQEDLFQILEDAIEAREELQETVQKIKDLYEGYRQNGRAETIARTETSNIKNFVSYNEYERNDEIVGYEWLATGGSGSRKDHNRLDGDVIKKDEFFNVGGTKAKRPYDSSLPKDQVINCRCDVLPVFDI
jgi:HK97 family phage portal protein